MKIIGIILMIVGAGMAFFVRRIIRYTKWRPANKEDEEGEGFEESLSAPAMVFKLIGFAIVVVGTVVFFRYT